jgi:hypothetical protein
MLYLGVGLAGKIDFEFLNAKFMGESGFNWKALYFKARKGLSYNTDQLLLDCMSLSKLRLNTRITRANMFKVSLDYDEFAMFICQIVLYLKKNSMGPKAWAE